MEEEKGLNCFLHVDNSVGFNFQQKLETTRELLHAKISFSLKMNSIKFNYVVTVGLFGGKICVLRRLSSKFFNINYIRIRTYKDLQSRFICVGVCLSKTVTIFFFVYF